jgi:uncharacterized membrane protein (UPF0136 family)
MSWGSIWPFAFQTLERFLLMNKTNIWIILIYGIVIVALGYVGYREAGSKASLWSGLVFGGLLILSAMGMFAGQRAGAYTALGTTIFLTGVFSYRYAITGKGLPAILAVLSAGMLLFLLTRVGKWKS